MQAHGLFHRLVLIAGLVAIAATPAFAQRCATSATDDAAARGVRTAVSAAVTTAPKPGLAASTNASAAKPTPAGPLREERRKNSPALKASRPTQRVKASTPHAPAAPGMGSLLKWTIGAGRDMSSLFEDDDTNDRSNHIIAGRAPPRAGPPTDLPLPALTPVASNLWMREVQGPVPCGPTPFLTTDASTSHRAWQLLHAPRDAEPCASIPGGSDRSSGYSTENGSRSPRTTSSVRS